MTKKKGQRRQPDQSELSPDEYRKILAELLRDVEGLQRLHTMQARLISEIRNSLRRAQRGQ
jgi:hypothetical protein